MKTRTIIKHTNSGDLETEMIKLTIGDKFTIKEPDGTYVGTYVAAGEPYLNENNITTIMCNSTQSEISEQ